MRTFEAALESIRRMCEKEKQNTDRIRTLLSGKPLILYGAGTIGSSVAQVLKQSQIEVSCFCDKNKTGHEASSGLPIISPQQMIKQYHNANVIVCSENYKNEIIRDLTQLNVRLDHIYTRDRLHLNEMTYQDFLPHMDGCRWTFDFLEDDKSKQVLMERIRCYLTSMPITSSGAENQYFDPEIITLGSQEIFVDGGMYTGDTAQTFFRFSNHQYEHYYGFEPDQENFLAAKKCLCSQTGITLEEKGLWSKNMRLAFNGNLTSSSRLEESTENNSVEVIALDIFFQGKKPPTFIKMDIEGAELEALKGAKQLICGYKPKLAICVYHKREDIYTIPKLLRNFRDDYKFYLRHYSDTIYETVLYAV